ncbi:MULTISPECIES: cytochrome o ubiquinol oxidase subunit IV [Burkholderia]|uniref:Cytochrome bo(3) ubiquinol oxidase subunit 4 n=1 Tax=Burkholderia mayonis TaxID=1385591 RepID=A0A1B4FNW5_9BURK|nr:MULTISPECIES: cytochrome o ubiquinol oxidase subunit IV [Burkholderia]AOJ05335.1 cytochrome o ubiquinol oxidase subunit IV [Burkholderia mayonis]KVE36921.1 cytochrome o ubiquinol oxidase subunit IV [Burkholderia sp. BDU5]KVE40659.1 cytochrome o ubiquinol oxidase subunit IV [Burkholderia mayonis]
MTDTHLSHDGEAHGTAGGYVAGFILSVLLTAASFGLVLSGALSSHASLIALAALAFVQIVVHLVYFLHMNGSSGQRWNVMAFSYTVLTAAILIVGTLWVMHNVGMNMMSR